MKNQYIEYALHGRDNSIDCTGISEPVFKKLESAIEEMLSEIDDLDYMLDHEYVSIAETKERMFSINNLHDEEKVEIMRLAFKKLDLEDFRKIEKMCNEK